MSLFFPKSQSFEKAVAPFEKQLYFTCLGMMGNSQDAQDCAQEAILKAFKNYPKFRGDSNLGTWLYTIASRCCIDALNKRKETLSLDKLREDGWDPPETSSSPYLVLEEAERSNLLRQAIQKLSVEQRQVITLCDLQGFSYEQAAEIAQCPVGTVRSRLNRARITLKNILKKHVELFSAEESLIDERRETV